MSKLPEVPYGSLPREPWVAVLENLDIALADPERVAEAAGAALAEISRLRAALAGHLFDGESVSTREAVRHELLVLGSEALARSAGHPVPNPGPVPGMGLSAHPSSRDGSDKT